MSKETNKLANMFHSNKKEYTGNPLFTKKGSTSNLLCVYGLKELGGEDTTWLNNYRLTPTQNMQSGSLGGNINTSRPSRPSIPYGGASRVGGGGGGSTGGY